MGLRTKAKYEKECLRKKVLILLRKDINGFYSSRLDELIDLISDVQTDKETKFDKILNISFTLLAMALSINKIIAILLDKENKQFKLYKYRGYNNIHSKDFCFTLDSPFIKELQETNNSPITPDNFRNFPQGYGLNYGIPLASIGKYRGVLLFEEPGVNLEEIDKQYLRILSYLLAILEKEGSLSRDTMPKIEAFIDKFTKELSSGETKEKNTTILNTLSKIKEAALNSR